MQVGTAVQHKDRTPMNYWWCSWGGHNMAFTQLGSWVTCITGPKLLNSQTLNLLGVWLAKATECWILLPLMCYSWSLYGCLVHKPHLHKGKRIHSVQDPREWSLLASSNCSRLRGHTKLGGLITWTVLTASSVLAIAWYVSLIWTSSFINSPVTNSNYIGHREVHIDTWGKITSDEVKGYKGHQSASEWN